MKIGALIVYDITDVDSFQKMSMWVKELRQQLGADIPIIIVTAKTTESDKLIGLETGADDYMTKPFSMKELAARIRAVMRRMSPKSGKVKKDDKIIQYSNITNCKRIIS